MNTQRPPSPPFTVETPVEKVRLAEDGWNSRDPEKVALAYQVAAVQFDANKPGEADQSRQNGPCGYAIQRHE